MTMQNPYDYVSWFFSQIKHLHDLSKKIYPYRLIERSPHSTDSHAVFKVQITGKSTIFEMTACEIAADDQILTGFSPKDIRIIIYFATKQSVAPMYRVEAQTINNETGEMTFDLFDGHEIIRKSAREISADRGLLTNLNTIDAHMIGYQSASENLMRERKQINLLKDRCESV